MGDLVRTGLGASPPGDSAWATQAARLVDAQATGLASRVRRLDSLPRAGDRWAERLADGLGRLALLCRALRRLDALEPALAAEVRAAAGWTLEREEVLAAGTRLRDDWAVVGQVGEDDERLRMQRTWLRGATSGRDALVLQFAAGAARFPEVLLPGTVVEAELAFWPGSAPLRAVIAQRHGDMRPLTKRPGAVQTIGDFLAHHAQTLARQPWIDRFPAALRDVVPTTRDAARFFVADTDGLALPVDGQPWKLHALAGGQPVDVYGEWDGYALRALGAVAEGRYHALVAGEPVA
jgi:hypothetical protein